MTGRVSRPRWGLLDIVLVYGGIFIITNLVGWYSIGSWWAKGRPLVQFVLVAGVQFLVTIALVLLFALGRKASREDLGLRPAPLRDILIYGCGKRDHTAAVHAGHQLAHESAHTRSFAPAL